MYEKEMSKKVLDVGNCGPDNFTLTDLVSNQFGAEVVRAHGMQDALEQLRNGSFDLVTVNRKMDRDGSSGLEIIKAIKADEALASNNVMMVTNFDDHQKLAVDAGAEPGYGKKNINSAETLALFEKYLG